MLKIEEVRRGKEIGKLGYNRYVWVSCPGCGVEHWVEYRFYKNGKYKGRGMCGSCAQFHPNGGKSQGWLNKRGYRIVILGKGDFFYSMTGDRGRIFQHRLVMAKHLKRCLLLWELVHHLNGIKDDNRLENLALTTNRKHNKKPFTQQLQQRIGELEAENTALNAKMGESN